MPRYIEVDGLVVPLRVQPATNGRPAGIGHAGLGDRTHDLAGLSYIVDALLGDDPADVLQRIDAHRELPLPMELAAGPVNDHFDDYREQAAQWERLTGRPTTLDDVYYIGTSFTREKTFVIPRKTFLELMRRLYELDAAVRDGRIEARIDTSMPIPAPRPVAPPQPAGWTDDELRDLDQRLANLDRLDPIDRPLDPDGGRRIALLRGSMFLQLDALWRRTSDDVEDMPARYRALGLATLVAYDEAIDRLIAYLYDPARIAITGTDPPESPFEADVSVDLFRLPEAKRPAGIGHHAWLARAEALLVGARADKPDQETPGELFTRVGDTTARLRYRREAGPHLVLWRVEPA